MDAFCIKIMRFAGFLRVQIYSWNANVSWTLQSTLSGAVWYGITGYATPNKNKNNTS